MSQTRTGKSCIQILAQPLSFLATLEPVATYYLTAQCMSEFCSKAKKSGEKRTMYVAVNCLEEEWDKHVSNENKYSFITFMFCLSSSIES